MSETDAPAAEATLLSQLAELRAERERLTAALALAERDRQLLGYEVHDGIVQDLTAAAMLLESVGREASFASGEAREHYGGGLRLLREAIAEARRLIGGLESVDFGKQDLTASLARLVEKFRTTHEMQVTLISFPEVKVPASSQHLLLRIVHEALYNVWKHAQTSRADVRLQRHGNELTITVEDQGIGFNPNRTPHGHFGLDGMHARAHVLGGDLQIESVPGRGTCVSIRLPLPAE